MTTLDPQVAALLKDPSLLIPAIVQDSTSKEVLMLAYMNPESLQMTLSTGKATYWSRSRNELWIKGETSGHFQQVQSISLDCDGDALLLEVIQTGVACHTGERTCFHSPLDLRS
jgi:phosphoribosyl-AMP cyclohydrolase